MTPLPYFRVMRSTLAATVCAAVALVGGSLATAAVKPVLRVGADNALRGSHFKAHELVRVVFTSDVRRVRVLRASATGSFAAVLPAADSCSSLHVRATGATGDVAAIALSLGLCPPLGASASQSLDNQPPQTGTNVPPDQHGPPTVGGGSG